jgi:hypothetical protein
MARVAGGRAQSAPLLGRASEPTIFEISESGRSCFQLRSQDLPEWELDELIPAEHRGEAIPLAEVRNFSRLKFLNGISLRTSPD